MPNRSPEFNFHSLSDNEKIHFAAIGKVAAEWAWLEFWIDTKTLELTKIQFEAGLCVTAQVVGSARKLDAYIALARHLGIKKASADLEAFAKDTVGLAERRNRAIHDPWLVEKGLYPSRLEATARRTLRFLVVPVGTDELLTLIDLIMDHVARFDRLHHSIASELNK